MMGMLSPWLIVAMLLSVGSAGIGGYIKGRQDATAASELVQLRENNAALIERQKLQEQVNAITVQSQKDKRAIAGRLNAALDSLRNRPEDRLPEAARAACAGATGRELSGQDGEFLSRLAAEADGLRSDLDACQKWISAIKK